MTGTTTTTSTGSAERWGPLWGARPDDWALTEDQQLPVYDETLARLGAPTGKRLLDVGCGVGAFLQLATAAGAVPFGIDASDALIEIARGRIPEADLRVGDMEDLPWPDDSFDVVTGFSSFFFANDIVGALREAGRVARPGAPVAIQVWGPHERNDLEPMKEIMRRFLPPRPADAPADQDLSRPGVLDGIVREAGLTPETAFETAITYTYADADALGRALVAPAGLVLLAGIEREQEVRDAIVDALASFRRADGSYRLSNQFDVVIARA